MKKLICFSLASVFAFALFSNSTVVHGESANYLSDLEGNTLSSGNYVIDGDYNFSQTLMIEDGEDVVLDLQDNTLTFQFVHNDTPFFKLGVGSTFTIKNGDVVFTKGPDSYGYGYNFVEIYGNSTFNAENVDFISQSNELRYEWSSTQACVAEYISPYTDLSQSTYFKNCSFSGELTAIAGGYVSSLGYTTENQNTTATFEGCTFNTIGRSIITYTLDELTFDNCEITNNSDIEIDFGYSHQNCLFYNSSPSKGSLEEEEAHNKVTLKDVKVKDAYALIGVGYTSANYAEYYLEGDCNFGDCYVVDVQDSLPYEEARTDSRIIIHDNRTNKTEYKVGLSCQKHEADASAYDFDFIKTEKDNLQYIKYDPDYVNYQAATSTDDTYGYLVYKHRALDGFDGNTIKSTTKPSDGTTYAWYEMASEATYITNKTEGLVSPFAEVEDASTTTEPIYDEDKKAWFPGAYDVDGENELGLPAIKKTGNSLLVVSVEVKGSDIKYLNDLTLTCVEEYRHPSLVIKDSKGNIIESSEREEDVNKEETYTYTYYILEEGTYCVAPDTSSYDKAFYLYNYRITECTLVANETTDTISFATKDHNYICIITYSYYEAEDSLISDVLVGNDTKEDPKKEDPKEDDSKEEDPKEDEPKDEDPVVEEKSYGWLIPVISVVVVIGAYLVGFFAFYLKGKAKGKFFEIIYSWFKKLLKK